MVNESPAVRETMSELAAERADENAAVRRLEEANA
jgi:hypothetical protein